MQSDGLKEAVIKVRLALNPPEPTGTCDVQKAQLQPLNHVLAQGDLFSAFKKTHIVES